MKIQARDLVSTFLVLLIAAPYIIYLARGDAPFVEDARGMAAVGLLLGTAAYLVLSQGDPRDHAGKLEDVVALVSFLLGFTAFALAETAVAEALLAVFMGSIAVTLVIKLMDHGDLLPRAHPSGSA